MGSTEIRTRPKKARKPQARTLPLRTVILAVAAEYELFYQLVSRKAVDKTEAAYKRVCDVSGQMRRTGRSPTTRLWTDIARADAAPNGLAFSCRERAA